MDYFSVVVISCRVVMYIAVIVGDNALLWTTWKELCDLVLWT